MTLLTVNIDRHIQPRPSRVSRRFPMPRLCLLGCMVALLTIGGQAAGFVPQQRWSTTSSGPTGISGGPITLTWSFVPDGTAISNRGPSNLIATLDARFGAGPGGEDLTNRPWFTHFQAALDRWTELGGVTFNFEPADDGAQHGSHEGVLGVRGDIRFGGVSIDGTNGTLAFGSYPNFADVVLDIDDAAAFSNPSANYRRLRNVLMHEVGHGLGWAHVESSDAALLMEPSLNLSFDGPQLDEIRGLHWYYGDSLEKSNGGLGNGTPARATDLGLITAGSTATVGGDAGPDLAVDPADVDFVSITNTYDTDFYSFTIDQPGVLNALLTPRGGIFHQGTERGTQELFDANARNDLTLSVYDVDGTSRLARANDQPAGGSEAISHLSLPAAGQYYARVSGATSSVQLYQLDLSVVTAVTQIAGDYNGDGFVDAADYLVWRDTLGQTGDDLAADGNANGLIDQPDYQRWKTHFGSAPAGGAGANPLAVPEPVAAFLAAMAIAVSFTRMRIGSADRPVPIARSREIARGPDGSRHNPCT